MARPETLRRTFSRQASMEWYRPLPLRKEVTWSARDNPQLSETAALAALDYRRQREIDAPHFYKRVGTPGRSSE